MELAKTALPKLSGKKMQENNVLVDMSLRGKAKRAGEIMPERPSSVHFRISVTSRAHSRHQISSAHCLCSFLLSLYLTPPAQLPRLVSSPLLLSAGRPRACPQRPCALRSLRRPRLSNRSPAHSHPHPHPLPVAQSALKRLFRGRLLSALRGGLLHCSLPRSGLRVLPTLEVYADEHIEMEGTGEDPTTSSKRIVSFENVPAARKFCKYSPGYIADTAYDMTLVHRDYRGQDRRTFRMRAKDMDGKALKYFRKKPFDAPRPACLEVSLVNGRSIVWGSLSGYEDVKEKSPITVIHRIDTQYPSMEIVVAPDPGDKHGKAITCIIYAEAIEEGLEGDETLRGLWSAESHEFGDDYWEDYGAAFGYANGTDPAFRERQSWTTMMKIDSRRKSTQALPVPERSKVKFRGINPGRVEELRVQILEGSDVPPPADDPEGLGFDPYEDLSY